MNPTFFRLVAPPLSAALVVLVACSDSESPSSGLGSTLTSQSGGAAAAAGSSGSSGATGGNGSGGGAGAGACPPGREVYNGTQAIDLTATPPCRRQIREKEQPIYCQPGDSCLGIEIYSYWVSEHDGLLEYQWPPQCRGQEGSFPPGWRGMNEGEEDLIKNAPACPDQAED